MKTRHILPALALAGASVSFLPGCYTQLATYNDSEPGYSDDSYEYREETAPQVYDDTYYNYPRTRFWLSFSYGYPDWYYYTPSYSYYPYYWDRWNYTVIYPYPWWWDWPYYGHVHSHWYTHRPLFYSYHDPYYTYRPGGTTTTRNSGVRRSGTERRRDYDPGRSSGTVRAGAATPSGGRTSAVGERETPTRSAPTGRTPSIEFTRPRSGESSGRSATSSRSSSGRSSSVWEIITRSVTRGSSSRGGEVSSSSSSSGGDETARPSRGSSSRPSYTRPSSPAPSRSSAPARSSSSSRSSGSSRSGDSGRRR